MPDVHVKLSASVAISIANAMWRPQVWQTNRFKCTNGKLRMHVQWFKVFSKLAACLIFLPKEYISRSAEVCSEVYVAGPFHSQYALLMTGSNMQVNSVMETEDRSMQCSEN